MFKVDPGLNPHELAPVFRRFGRMHIPGILDAPSAQRLGQGLLTAQGWSRAVHVDEGRDVDFADFDEATDEERAAVEAATYAAARDEFRYMFDTIRLSEPPEGAPPVDPLLEAAAAFLRGPEFLAFIRALTGDERPVYADAMATRYLPGHFLTAHDDRADHLDRLYAYVLNLTPRWRADWGGVLLFLDEEDHVEEGYVPVFNSLNIFRVPQRHAVSLVAPFAGGPRLAITGWIRARPPQD
ncbi:2OG-Fe(II) oxygenase family protein [Brevundimonas sp. 2R-24]|uniref:2OG-Fe(II) oxygenase family protein n=1 Tax=Peiella sedimenti TaxID=3061083 RepID=A0ABT8SHD4_9CAUL|nr:2OG-Fe(II) oxygenase family protein [Caulobacteraceae bacterium XZ-24]